MTEENHDEQATLDDAPQDSHGSGSRLRRLRWGCLSALVLFLVLWAVLHVAVWAWVRVEMERVCGASYPELKAFLSGPADFPEDWLEPPPVSAALREAVARADAAKPGRANLPNDIGNVFAGLPQEGPPSAQWEEAARMLLEETAPFVESLMEVAAVIDLELRSLEPGEPYGGIAGCRPGYAYLSGLFVEPKLLCNVGSVLMQQGNVDEAFEHYLAALRLLARHPGTDFHNPYMAFHYQSDVLNRFTHIVATCDDPVLLKSALEELNRLEPHINHRYTEQALLLILASQLNELRTRGGRVFPTPDRPAWYYARQTLPPSELWRTIERIADRALGGSDSVFDRWIVLHLLRSLTVSSAPDRLAYAYLIDENYSAFTLGPQTRIYEQAVFAFELQRLQIAGRLHTVETGVPPRAVSDVVPKWLPDGVREAPHGGIYRWDESGNVFLSGG